MYRRFNENPCGRDDAIDCTVRAISMATGDSWDYVQTALFVQAKMMCNMPSSDDVWGRYLIEEGFSLHYLPGSIYQMYTVKDFCADHQEGTYVLKAGDHAVCVKDGHYYDSWDSGNRIVLFYYSREAS